MNHFHDVYDTREDRVPQEGIVRFFFTSEGKRDIIKIIQYQYVRDFEGCSLFNLGFADYDHETGAILDQEISSNDEAYKIFHTVLNTVPKLFDTYENAIIMVKGSDSKQEFIDNCKLICSRKCGNNPCKKAHRRINIYRGFVDKHFDVLNQQYSFSGGNDIETDSLMESYEKVKKYISILAMKKSLN